uniref:Large terminase n=1 Tax=Siphoviridae sp. ctZHD14 TaxID=2827891 RepID=A0A8S5SVP7_9CAUD|nr:MAG TPA: large terminase [Siphoviridae sp. ctZHD14]
MALKDLLTVASGKRHKKVEVDKEKIKEHLPDYQRLIDYWRKYPDKFIDYLCSLNPDNTFRFYFIQRLVLRLFMRYRTVYAVFSRGFSKSFLAVLVLMIKAILYPGSKLATVAGGKSQSASILSSKMLEICQLIPAIANEIVWDTRGKIAQTTQSKDQVTYAFKNGSQLSNAAMTEGTRGQRFQSILVEESAKVDQEKLTEIIMPTLVISRQINGEVDLNEVLNQSAIFVTSAGYKGTYAYEKLIDTLCHSVAGKDNEAFILGGDWKIPVVEGLQPANFIQAQENDNSMDEAGFDREYKKLLYSINIINCWKILKKLWLQHSPQGQVRMLENKTYIWTISSQVAFYVIGSTTMLIQQ